MLERAGARLWVSIVAAVNIFPAAAVLLLAAWAIRVQIAVPMRTDPSAVTLAAAPPISPVQVKVEEKVEAAVPPRRATATEPIALPPQAPEPCQRGRHRPGHPPPVPIKSGPPQRQPRSKLRCRRPLRQWLNLSLRHPTPKRPGPLQRRLCLPRLRWCRRYWAERPPPTPIQPKTRSLRYPRWSKPATLELSEPISGPVPLPKPKPRVTVAHVSRAVPLPRSRPELIR